MVERFKKLCEKNKTNFSQLEKALGFANGSLAKSKEDKIAAIRLKSIADYFHVSMEYLLTGNEYPVSEPAAGMSLSYEEMNIIKAYRKLSEPEKNIVAKSLDVKRQDTDSQSKMVG